MCAPGDAQPSPARGPAPSSGVPHPDPRCPTRLRCPAPDSVILHPAPRPHTWSGCPARSALSRTQCDPAAGPVPGPARSPLSCTWFRTRSPLSLTRFPTRSRPVRAIPYPVPLSGRVPGPARSPLPRTRSRTVRGIPCAVPYPVPPGPRYPVPGSVPGPARSRSAPALPPPPRRRRVAAPLRPRPLPPRSQSEPALSLCEWEAGPAAHAPRAPPALPAGSVAVSPARVRGDPAGSRCPPESSGPKTSRHGPGQPRHGVGAADLRLPSAAERCGRTHPAIKGHKRGSAPGSAALPVAFGSRLLTKAGPNQPCSANVFLHGAHLA